VANYNLGADWNGQDGHVVGVGRTGRLSVSGYGTFDQGGNVAEWTETLVSTTRVVRGGSWADTFARLRSDGSDAKTPSTEDARTGFRVARVLACPDADGDGSDDCVDNCVGVANAGQVDADQDGIGDACDNCPIAANRDQANADRDGPGNACDLCPNDATNDQDGDGICGGVDNCPTVANPTQADGDADGDGDACDNCGSASNSGQEDRDADGVGDACDNCITVANANQYDGNADGRGDACLFVPVDGSNPFLLSATEVTNQEYAAFLNAVAKSDPNGLFNSNMQSGSRSGISRSGSSPSYSYSVKSNFGTKPVNYVSWLDAARYCNWLHNGKPTARRGIPRRSEGPTT